MEYIKPEAQVIAFDADDVITTSATGDDNYEEDI